MSDDTRNDPAQASRSAAPLASPAASRPLTLVQVEGLLNDWEPFLDEVEPASVFAVSGKADDGRK